MVLDPFAHLVRNKNEEARELLVEAFVYFIAAAEGCAAGGSERGGEGEKSGGVGRRESKILRSLVRVKEMDLKAGSRGQERC